MSTHGILHPMCIETLFAPVAQFLVKEEMVCRRIAALNLAMNIWIGIHQSPGKANRFTFHVTRGHKLSNTRYNYTTSYITFTLG